MVSEGMGSVVGRVRGEEDVEGCGERRVDGRVVRSVVCDTALTPSTGGERP